MEHISSYKKNIIVRCIAMLLSVAAVVVLFKMDRIYLAILCCMVVVWEIIALFRLHLSIAREFERFVEAVHYHDFSQSYSRGQKLSGMDEFRAGFNAINKEFLKIGKEREAQQQYLQKILELVDTGILLYDIHTGEVLWMNEALRQLLKVPFFKHLSSIEKRKKDIYAQLQKLSAGKSVLVNIKQENTALKVQLSASVFQIDNKHFKLVVFQNVNEAIDITESQAWNKLLRVLTHEIMNSVAPISSLAATIQENINNPTAGSREDILLGIRTIKNRSEGLLKFAEAYRNLNKIEKPNVSTFYIRDLFESLDVLFGPTLVQREIELDIILKDTNLKLSADRSLIDQVFINLVLNAMEAVKGKNGACIQLYAAHLEDKRIEIKILDNGHGMDEEIMERIFIPFFTTKKSGSGIGLSLCKQIMLLHGGMISVHSIEGEGTVFSVVFPL